MSTPVLSRVCRPVASWVLVCGAALALTCSLPSLGQAAEDDSFKSIFNGENLDEWDGNPKFWSIEEGCITGTTTAENPTSGNTFAIWKGGNVENFELRFSYRIVGGNSGVQYRSKDQGNWVVGGYQADIDSGDTFSGILYEERGRGILCNRGQKSVVTPEGKVEVEGSVGDSKELQANIKKNDWNEYVLIADGNHLVHAINGGVTADFTDNDPGKRSMSGILALQLHAGPPMKVQFKNLRLKVLTAR